MPLNSERKNFINAKIDTLQKNALNEHFSNILSARQKTIYKSMVEIQKAKLAGLTAELESLHKSSKTKEVKEAINKIKAEISKEKHSIEVIVQTSPTPREKSRLSVSRCIYYIQGEGPNAAKSVYVYRFIITLCEDFIDIDPTNKALIRECRRKIAHEIAHLDLLVDDNFIRDNSDSVHTVISGENNEKQENEADYYAQNLINKREDFHYNYLTATHQSDIEDLKAEIIALKQERDKIK